ncbi:helix-turn-helix transcriptional regulator [Klenkia taihuensis]|uniref:AraC-type DNA-binding protein n=1 Tax=Klenkia taihuensis TaxID=1225127 RepID=A0A1I1RFV2_9ACTN|nr:helix-turn-helix transcriptional regulator [Klenkia taihuensis]GHE07148.1 hypothetical protein GCM10011381_02080 [Klenkia taihuensis]SFD30443.1 AraC-type DNA-binding protein [Klenkia taihuensis]
MQTAAIGPRATFSTGDPDEMAAFLTRSYGTTVRLGRTREPHRLSHHRAAAGHVALDTVRSSGFAADAGPTGHLVVVVVDTGSITRRTGGRSRDYGPGDVFVAARPSGDVAAEWRGSPAAIRALVLDAALVAAVTGAAPEQVATMAVDTDRPAGAAAARRFHQALAFATTTVLHDEPAAPRTAAPPLLVDAVARTLAATVLTVFDSSLVPAHRTADAADARPETLRRAVAYIESGPHLPMGLADIARAAYVTPRAVQLAFRKHLDCTPLEYLRRVRLAAAHQELVDAEPGDGTTVTAVAQHWGMDGGRFGQTYRAAYGVPPSRTLGD